MEGRHTEDTGNVIIFLLFVSFVFCLGAWNTNQYFMEKMFDPAMSFECKTRLVLTYVVSSFVRGIGMVFFDFPEWGVQKFVEEPK